MVLDSTDFNLDCKRSSHGPGIHSKDPVKFFFFITVKMVRSQNIDPTDAESNHSTSKKRNVFIHKEKKATCTHPESTRQGSKPGQIGDKEMPKPSDYPKFSRDLRP